MGCLSLLFCGESTDPSEAQYTYFPLSTVQINSLAPLPPLSNHPVADPEYEEALGGTSQRTAYDDSDAPEPSNLAESRDHMRTGAERKVQIQTQAHELPSGLSAQVGNWISSSSSPPAPAPNSHINSSAIPETDDDCSIPAPDARNVWGAEDEPEGRGSRRVRGRRSSPPPPVSSARQTSNDHHTEGRLGEQSREGHRDGSKPWQASLSSGSSTRKALCELRTPSAACQLQGTAAESGRRNADTPPAVVREYPAGDQLRRRKVVRDYHRSGPARRGDM